MAALADVERVFERIFERSTARLFRARLQVVQLEHRVERAMERARVTSGSRTEVPARYRVRLNPRDLDDVASAADGPEVLAGRLADAALGFARLHGYHLPARPMVALVADPTLERGVVEVEPVALPVTTGHDPSLAAAAWHSAVVPDMPVIAPRPEEAMPIASGAQPAAAAEAVTPEIADARPGSIRGDGTETLVFRRPVPQPTRAVLRVILRNGTERTVEVDGSPLALGRASDNTLVIADPRVSRHHARLQARRGTLVFTDLTSTNGSRVNGVRVDECALGTGDRIQVGDAMLVVEQLPG